MLTKVSPGIETITGRKNILINGNFNIWQRGNGPFPIATTGIYTADRMFCARAGSVGGYTVSQVTGDMGLYAIKLQRDQGDTDIGNLNVNQYIETCDCIPLRGKNLVAKVRLKVGANFSGTSVILLLSTTSDTDLTVSKNSSGAINSGSTDFTSDLGVIIPTTSFVDYEIDLGVIASTANLIDFRLRWTPEVGTAGADDSITIDRIQLEVGKTATEFESVSISKELKRCRRYYHNPNGTWSLVSNDPDTYRRMVFSQMRGTSMRITPTESFTFNGSVTNIVAQPSYNKIEIRCLSNDDSEKVVESYKADAEI